MSPETQPHVFTCGSCKQEITVRFLKPGETARCPHCGAGNIVPGDAASASELDQMPDRSRQSTVVSGTDPFPRSPAMVRINITFLFLLLLFGTAFFVLAIAMHDYQLPIQFSALLIPFVVVFGLWAITAIVQTILFLVWIFRLHLDLRHLYANYSPGPVQAALLVFIPVYQLYGFWSVFSRLSAVMVKKAKLSRSLRFWVALFYVTMILGYTYVITMLWPSQTLSYEGLFASWDLLQIGLGLVSYVALIRIISLVNDALGLEIQRSR